MMKNLQRKPGQLTFSQRLVLRKLIELFHYQQGEFNFVIGGKVISLSEDYVQTLLENVRVEIESNSDYNLKTFELVVYSIGDNNKLNKHITTASLFLNQLVDIYKIKKGWI